MEIIKITDSAYPKVLSEIYNPPQKLYYKGNLEHLKKPCISVVGTRDFSEYGKFVTEKIIEELSVLDITIVSGLAKGIDTIAHSSAIKNGLSTIAVLGSGLNKIYPKENEKLAKKIIKEGLILSEYEPDQSPISFHFPQRNRIVSGLSVATIVTEAPESSGALITARLALEQGRDIYVTPGDIDRKSSLGTIKLLQMGAAYAVGSGTQIVELLKSQSPLFKYNPNQKTSKKSAALKSESDTDQLNLDPDEKQILSAIPLRHARSLDQIQSKTAIPTKTLLSTLSILEIKGFIKTTDGKYLRKY